MTARRSATILAALGTAALLGPAAAPANAQHADHADHARSPYVDLQDREIKALAPEDVRALRAGEGMGFALAAELNGVPGPRHALDLDAQLALSTEQRGRLEGIFERMNEDAVALGDRIVALEAELDRRFAHAHIDSPTLDSLSLEIGRLNGRLRAVHLRAHLETAAVLTDAQVARYAELRGYRTEDGSPDASEG